MSAPPLRWCLQLGIDGFDRHLPPADHLDRLEPPPRVAAVGRGCLLGARRQRARPGRDEARVPLGRPR
eukprot:6131701-Prymnesium_polylepis.1